MRPLTRWGTTLLELLIALTMLVCFSAACTVFVTGMARATRRTTTALAEHRTLSTTGRVMRHELGEAVSGEVTQMNASTLLFQRVVGDGTICQSDATNVWIAQQDWRGTRLPDATRDQLALLNIASTSSWLTANFTALAASHCPDGRTAWKFALDRSVPMIAYARVGEPVRLSVYRSNGTDWFGLTPGDGSSSVQPFAGPLLPGSTSPQVNTTQITLPGKYVSGRTFSIAIPLASSAGPLP